MWLSRYAKLVSASTVLLIVAGGLVTSTGSGLSVPDWPTSYGWSMFTFPLRNMIGGIFYEHGHRLIASTVGFLTIILAAWIWRAEPRRWVRALGFAALGAVILQGVLGGITVLFFLPTAISTAHAGLAQIFFCLTVTIALVTSRSWNARPAAGWVNDRTLRLVAATTTAIISSAPPCGTQTPASPFRTSLWCSGAWCRRSGRRKSPFTTRTVWVRSSRRRPFAPPLATSGFITRIGRSSGARPRCWPFLCWCRCHSVA
jgi:heme A synthase